MTLTIRIGSANHIDYVDEQLQRQLFHLETAGLKVKLQHQELGQFTFWDLMLPGKPTEEHRLLLRQQLATALTRLIVTNWEHLLVKKLTEQHYAYLQADERQVVLQRTELLLQSKEPLALVFPERFQKIRAKLVEYLEQNNNLLIDGFITFRLQDYRSELCRVLEQAAEEYLMEKEYLEFIRLLRYFVEVQEPRLQKVHVVLIQPGVFQLYDANNNHVSQEYLDSVVMDLLDNDMSYEDLLLSALITIAPLEVVLHVSDEEEDGNIIKTVKNVFLERVKLCTGCQWCSGHRRKNKRT